MLPLGRQFDIKENRGRKLSLLDNLPIIKVSEIINILKKSFSVFASETTHMYFQFKEVCEVILMFR